MKKIIGFLAILLLSFSCEDKNTPERPKDLISEDKMVDILIDLSLISSAKGLNKKVIENNGITPDRYVFEKHNIDSVQFSQSNAYYAYFLDDYTNIYERVKDSLEKLKIKYVRLDQAENKKKTASKPRKNERATRDSLRNSQNDSLLLPPNFDDN